MVFEGPMFSQDCAGRRQGFSTRSATAESRQRQLFTSAPSSRNSKSRPENSLSIWASRMAIVKAAASIITSRVGMLPVAFASSFSASAVCAHHNHGFSAPLADCATRAVCGNLHLLTASSGVDHDEIWSMQRTGDRRNKTCIALQQQMALPCPSPRHRQTDGWWNDRPAAVRDVPRAWEMRVRGAKRAGRIAAAPASAILDSWTGEKG